MIDIQTEELAALYVLDLLNGRDRQAFEARMDRDPELCRYVRSLADDTAMLALAAPRVKPPADIMVRVEAALDSQDSPKVISFWSAINRVPAAWPMAACLMLTCTVFFLMAERIADSTSGNLSAFDPKNDPVTIRYELNERIRQLEQMELENQRLKQSLSQIENSIKALSGSALASSQVDDELSDGASAGLTREQIRLQKEVDKLVQLAAIYSDSGPGLARLTVIELSDEPPGDYPSGFAENALRLLGEQLNSAVGGPSIAVAQSPINPQQAVPANSPPVPENANVKPAETITLDEQTAKNLVGGVNAVASTNTDTSSEDGVYTGDQTITLASAGNSINAVGTITGTSSASFTHQTDEGDRITLTVNSLGNNVSARQIADGLQTALPSNIPDDSVIAGNDSTPFYAPSGFVVWDDTRQVGTIGFYDLQRAPDGQVYQIWAVDPTRSKPVNVGILPDIEKDAAYLNGRIYFTVENTKLSPTNIFITAEPTGGSDTPSGRRVLQGPWGVSSSGSQQP